MKSKHTTTLMLLTIPLLLLFETYHFYNTNTKIAKIEFNTIENIDKYCYNYKVYLSYINDTPYFYIGEKKEYYIIPPYIKADNDLIPLVKELNFKINKSNYNLIITKKDINTSKMAIIFYPIKNSKKVYGNKTIFWIDDPLRLKKSNVEAMYSLPKKGEIIAKYEDGSPAAIKIKNKIYVGFKPDKETLANLIYIHITKKTPNPTPYIIITSLLFLISLIVAFKDAIVKKYYDLISTLSSFAIFLGRINIYDEEEVLLNDTRREIYNYILDNPGCHLRQISKDLNKSLSTITWHLRILEKSGLIISKKFGNKIMYFPSGMDMRDVLLLFIKNENQRSILNYLIKNSAHLRKIANDLNLNVETTRYHLRKLEKLGIVKSKEEGNKIVYYIDKSLFKQI